jgi:ribonuclease E
MEDRKNNAAVEKRLKDRLKSDRARIQVGRISGFGLLEMRRQRLRPGMIEATTKACPHCHGTGRVRSDDSLALALLREIEEEGVRQRSKEVLIVAPVDIANYLLNQKREHIAMIEARFGLSVRVEGDAALVSPDYRIERFKTASRIIPAAPAPMLPAVAYPETEEDEDLAEMSDAEDAAEETAADSRAEGERSEGERSGGKRRRRRRRRGGRSGEAAPREAGAEVSEPPAEEAAEARPETEQAAEAESPPERPKSRRRSRGRGERTEPPAPGAKETPGEQATPLAVIDLGETELPGEMVVAVPETGVTASRRPRERVRKPVEAVLGAVEAPAPDEVAATALAAEPEPEPEPASAPEPAPVPEPVMAEGPAPAPVAAPVPERKRRGWWSRALGGGD